MPHTLIVGDSGSGKSSSIKNLNKTRTVILNIERKPLPFREAKEFGANNKMIESAPGFDSAFDSALRDKNVDTIVMESLQKYFEKLLELAKMGNKGYDIYNFYNEKVNSLLEKIKGCSTKQIFAFAMPERVENILPNGSITTVRRCFVHGKQWESKIEKEFSIVLWTEVSRVDKTKPAEYKFVVNNDGTFSAKSPPDMFKGITIDNDLALVQKATMEYYGLTFAEQQSPTTQSQKNSDVVINKDSLLDKSLLNAVSK